MNRKIFKIVSFISTGGSIFSSPKILTGTGNNPFAVRSSPGRMSNETGGSDTSNHAGASIIAPSKFGASASSPCGSSNSAPTGLSASSSSTSHSVKESHGIRHTFMQNEYRLTYRFVVVDASDCNGSSSKPLLRPSFIGTGFASSGTSQNHSSILKPATLGNPFARAVDIEDSPSATASERRGSGAETAESKPTLLMPSRLNVSAIGASPTAPAAASECSDEGSELAAIPASSDQAVTEPVVPSAAPRPSLTSGSLFSTAVTSAATPAPPTPTACTNFVFGQKLHERVAVWQLNCLLFVSAI